MSIAGTYDCTAATPVGALKAKLTLLVEDDRLTGHGTSDHGALDIENGHVTSVDTATWQMRLTKPMPLTLDVVATVAGDTLTAQIKLGFMGNFALTGTRVG